MGKRKFITQWLMLCFLLSHHLTQAQEQTVGLFFNDSEAFNGYTLFAPIRYTTTYLIDNDGRLVHSWESDYHPGQSVYLLENSHLLRTAKVDDHYRFNAGGYGGRVQEFTWDGTLMWDYINPVTDKGPVMQGEPVIVGPNKDKHINPVFHITRYTGEFPGLVDKDLTPGDPVEKYPTGIDKPNENNASRFSLNQNFPNPFNPSTAIDYHLSAFSDVELSVFNMRGQKVRILVDDNKPAGNYSVVWDGKDEADTIVPSGIYMSRLKSGGNVSSNRMMLIK